MFGRTLLSSSPTLSSFLIGNVAPPPPPPPDVDAVVVVVADVANGHLSGLLAAEVKVAVVVVFAVAVAVATVEFVDFSFGGVRWEATP